MIESFIEREFCEAVEDMGWLCLKLRIDGRDGFPDRTVITDRGCYFVEFKVPTGKMRPQQRDWMHKLEAAGQSYAVVRAAKKGVSDFVEWYELRR